MSILTPNTFPLYAFYPDLYHKATFPGDYYPRHCSQCGDLIFRYEDYFFCTKCSPHCSCGGVLKPVSVLSPSPQSESTESTEAADATETYLGCIRGVQCSLYQQRLQGPCDHSMYTNQIHHNHPIQQRSVPVCTKAMCHGECSNCGASLNIYQ